MREAESDEEEPPTARLEGLVASSFQLRRYDFVIDLQLHGKIEPYPRHRRIAPIAAASQSPARHESTSSSEMSHRGHDLQPWPNKPPVVVSKAE